MSFVALGELIRRHGARSPGRVAIQSSAGSSLTYGELDERSTKLARALLARGLGTGDRVAVWLGNRSEYVEIYLACAKARLTLVPINERSKAGEVRYQIDETEPLVAFVDGKSWSEFELLGSSASELPVVGCGEGTCAERGYEDLIATGTGNGDLPPAEPSDLLVIAYTSGTTGTPKGAMITHGAFKSAVSSCASVTGLPLYSVGVHGKSISLVGAVPGSVFGHLYMGGKLVLLERWETEEIFWWVEKTRANFVNIATPKISEIVDVVGRRPGSVKSVRTVMRSGMMASSEQVERLLSVVGNRYVTGWGMTENSGAFATATSFLDHERRDAVHVLGSVGRPVMETDLRLSDTDDLSSSEEEVGELMIRSPSLASGYWKRPEQSERAFEGGWYRTGDMGVVDTAGFVHIVDRRTDLIVSGGMNIYPREVEQVIEGLPNVAKCVVVGVAHPVWGRSPVAIVKPQGPVLVSEQEIIDTVRGRLASYKKPTAVLFREDIPENLSGKASRSILGEWASDQLGIVETRNSTMKSDA